MTVRRLIFTLDADAERREAEVTLAGVVATRIARGDYLVESAHEGDVRVVSITGCARCDGDGHPDLAFWPLVHPLEVGGVTMQWWAPCPTNGQPILLAVVDK